MAFCYRCGNEWRQQIQRPKRCPSCNSDNWDVIRPPRPTTRLECEMIWKIVKNISDLHNIKVTYRGLCDVISRAKDIRLRAKDVKRIVKLLIKNPVNGKKLLREIDGAGKDRYSAINT